MDSSIKARILASVKTEDCLRYLMYRNKGLSEKGMGEIENMKNEVLEDAQFKEIILTVDKDLLLAETASHDLAHTLRDVQKTAIVVCTLGHLVGQKIKKWLLVNPSKGVIYDAWASVIVEAFAECLQLSLGNTTNRFSPGYGDLPLTFQDKWLDELDASVRIGVYTTPASLMIPEKSIFFIVGLCDQGHKAPLNTSKCLNCGKSVCDYRRKI